MKDDFELFAGEDETELNRARWGEQADRWLAGVPETWQGSYWLDKFQHIQDPAEQFIAMVDAGAPNSALRDVQALNPDMFQRYFETHEYEHPWSPTHSRFRPLGLE